MIPYGRQSVDDDDIAAVVEVLKGDWLTQGPAVEEFETALCEVTGARHAVTFSSGTAALHGAAAAAGLGPGDIVATSALTFAASANCALFVGARVALVDIDPATLNLDSASVPTDCDALVAVHFAGLPVDLSLLPHRPRVIIEDAAHALGALTPDGPVGNCARSDMCTLSFHPVKAVTSGEGGAVTTNSAQLAERLRAFRNHGMVRKPQMAGWYYEIESLGYNHRLTDIQAALGRSQLAKLGRFVARRQVLAQRYRDLLTRLPITLPPTPPAGFSHAYHLFPVQLQDRGRVYEGLRAAGVGTQVHYVPVYRHPIHAGAGGADRFPRTEAAYQCLLSLPLYPALTDDDQDRVVTALTELLR
jgi:UDP-4-amino-4,6-dideoxy-N-acetyl-beta-L-altrosamine transaminase